MLLDGLIFINLGRHPQANGCVVATFHKGGILFAQTHTMAMLFGFNQSSPCLVRILAIGGLELTY
ncbi:MAG: hypothetical protein A3F78_22345 [Burkholderiales bacterium RIFCSPLOWO2_12_FULL_61_40]|nr:MAG: hypothetical protein A3F78_22345 [Burkholderiales bacterium RIFCSPLOWO2_12_FULL_61_40]